MGVAAAAIGGLQVASAVMGYKQQRSASKAAQRSADDQARAIGEQQNMARQEQSRINSRLDASKKKLAVGMARSQRRRSKGGLFGDSAEVASPAAQNLGG